MGSNVVGSDQPLQQCHGTLLCSCVAAVRRTTNMFYGVASCCK